MSTKDKEKRANDTEAQKEVPRCPDCKNPRTRCTCVIG
jgi:hypothetical protein